MIAGAAAIFIRHNLSSDLNCINRRKYFLKSLKIRKTDVLSVSNFQNLLFVDLDPANFKSILIVQSGLDRILYEHNGLDF